MDLLSEDRDPVGTLQYGLAIERGQGNQHKIANLNRPATELNHIGSTDVQYIKRNNTQPTTNIQQRTGILQTPKTGPIPADCWKCGYNFITGHLSNCTAKNEICRICEKLGHYAKLCRAEMPAKAHTETTNKNKLTKLTKRKHYKYKSRQQLSTKH